jgi:hypothetical protein
MFGRLAVDICQEKATTAIIGTTVILTTHEGPHQLLRLLREPATGIITASHSSSSRNPTVDTHRSRRGVEREC